MSSTSIAAAEPMTLEDAQVLALESGPIRGHTLKVLLVGDAPDRSPLPALCDVVESGLEVLPRWRRHLVPAPGTPAGLAWQDDPRFRVDRQVREVGGGAVDEAGLRRIVAAVMTDALDRSEPLWTLDVVPRLTDGRWALIWKVHHCLADGMTIMHAGSRLIWASSPSGTPESAGGGAAAGAGPPTGADPGRPPAGRRPAPGLPAQLRAGARLARAAGYRGLALREFGPLGRLSPLAAPVGGRRVVAFARCELADLHRIGRASTPHATVNDVLLAAVAGALRNWLLTRGPGTAIKAEVPVSMHHGPVAAEAAGNRDSFLLVGLPVREPDPLARLHAVSAATGLRKNRHDARAVYALGRAAARAPSPVRRLVQHLVHSPHEYSLNVSNVPGPRTPVYVLGRRVDGLCSIAEVAPRHALRVAAVSLAGTLFVGLCADPGAMSDVDGFARDVELEVGTLLDATGA
ncbi:wax ester/triacylglycerol synthase domain-containing protein [Streptomyces sp. MS06]|uniref:wax ester/triacylglycerol synthase domain-containing protein n=1 Tax=Streptomyces sp. MS06 TaxID=3385974 RepID=UPI0039A360E4